MDGAATGRGYPRAPRSSQPRSRGRGHHASSRYPRRGTHPIPPTWLPVDMTAMPTHGTEAEFHHCLNRSHFQEEVPPPSPSLINPCPNRTAGQFLSLITNLFRMCFYRNILALFSLCPSVDSYPYHEPTLAYVQTRTELCRVSEYLFRCYFNDGTFGSLLARRLPSSPTSVGGNSAYLLRLPRCASCAVAVCPTSRAAPALRSTTCVGRVDATPQC